jgi:hypothetical protein
MRLRPTVESLAKAKPGVLKRHAGLPPLIKDMLNRENNLLRQMAASDYNMYLLAQATTRARPANPPPTPTGRQESSSSSGRARASSDTVSGRVVSTNRATGDRLVRPDDMRRSYVFVPGPALAARVSQASKTGKK